MQSRAPYIRRPTILIASQQEWSSRSLESILAPHGYLVLRAHTGRGALDRARRDQPDAIIVDVQLPDGDGWGVCRALRANELISDSTPVLLALAEWPTRQNRLDARQAGIWDCFGQPLDTEEFLATLEVFVRAKLDADRARAEGLVDEATGLYNLRGLTRRARELGSQAARQHAPLGCVLLAADLGSSPLPPSPTAPPSPDEESQAGLEAAAAAALPRMVQALKSSGRRSDVIGQLAPLEFAVVAPGADAERARRLAQRLATAMLESRDSPMAPPPPRPPLRLHAGYYGVPDFRAAAIDSADLLLRATAALREARLDRTGPWLRSFDDGPEVSA